MLGSVCFCEAFSFAQSRLLLDLNAVLGLRLFVIVLFSLCVALFICDRV